MNCFQAAAVVGLLSTGAAQAANFSFTGNFANDADVAFFDFTILVDSDVTLRSYSYGGGTMADGTIIGAGGFDPILALWDSAGNLLNEIDDGPDFVNEDPLTANSFDTNVTLFGLAAGDYTASIVQFDNFSAGSTLAEGFMQSDPVFTQQYFCTNGQFCDVDGNNRTSFWAFDVIGVDAVAGPPPSVPLPAGLPLLLSGLAGVGLVARRKAKS